MAQSDLADLHRKRFVMTSETRQDQRLDEAKLKRICQGMGTIRAVRKYQNPFEFPETHKLWIDSNFRPAINGSDNAIWNRLHSIPFKITIPPAEIDQELRAKLLAESEGILAWAVAGAVRWYRDRLQKPEAVTTATDEWRSDNDAISRFISECCVIGSLYQIKASPLYRRYVGWMQEIGERPTSQRAFGQEISQKYPRKSSNGVWYVGLGLQSAEE